MNREKLLIFVTFSYKGFSELCAFYNLWMSLQAFDTDANNTRRICHFSNTAIKNKKKHQAQLTKTLIGVQQLVMSCTNILVWIVMICFIHKCIC